MNSKTILFFFCFLFNFVHAEDTLISFHGSSIRLPKGFTECSQEQLEEFKTTFGFSRPVMTIYEKIDTSGLQKILLYYDSFPDQEYLAFDKIIEIRQEVLQEQRITFKNVQINESHHWFFGEATMFWHKSLLGFSHDRHGVIGIQFDHENGITASDKTALEQLLKSIKHQSPYRYAPEERPEVKKAKKEMEDSGRNLTIAIVIVVVGWLLRKGMVKKKED